MREYIDIVVPRGGAELINFVATNARMPVLTGGVGVCHTYIDKDADLEKAVRIAFNAKTRNWSICNALDTLLVHADVAEAFMPQIAARAGEKRASSCAATSGRWPRLRRRVTASTRSLPGPTTSAWSSWRRWPPCASSIRWTRRWTTWRSTAPGIRTPSSRRTTSAAKRFTDEVDTAVVYVNASTQFTDGGQFGLGAEIIDSTQKTIARGPVGLREITTYKWLVQGEGQTRP